jgi:hypothetical protein
VPTEAISSTIQPQHDVSCRMEGNNRAVTAWRGRRRTKLSDPVSVSRSDAAEGRECVSHFSGALRMCACNGFEQGTLRETPYSSPGDTVSQPLDAMSSGVASVAELACINLP